MVYIIKFCERPMVVPTRVYNAEVAHVLWLKNFFWWSASHAIYWIYVIVQVLQIPLQFLNLVWIGICFWPRFYFDLFRSSNPGRSIWAILMDPGYSADDRLRPASRKGRENGSHNNKAILHSKTQFLFKHQDLCPTQEKWHLHSSYQVQGAYACLGGLDTDVVHSLRAALDTPILFKYSNDPLHLEVPYKFVTSRIKEPPDCLLDWCWAMFWHLFFMVLFISTGYFKFLYLRWTSSKVSQPKPAKKSRRRRCKFVKKRRHRPPLPIVKAYAFMTRDTDADEEQSRERTTWDTDGVPFYVDSCANCIISNQRDLFGELKKVQSSIQTHSGEDDRVRYMGTFRLELPDNDGKIWTYQIPGAFYDPHTPYNILGVVALSNFFQDTDPSNNPFATDGTWSRTSGARTELVWDHQKHTLNFLHKSDSQLPELILYQGNSYFNAFCTRVSRFYNSTVGHAFTTVYSVQPSNFVEDDEGEVGDVDMDQTIPDQRETWYTPPYSSDYCLPCSSNKSPEEQSKYPFKLGQNLLYKRMEGDSLKTDSVIYEGADASGKNHLIRRKDGTRIAVHDSTLVSQLQPSFENIPSSPLDYKREVGVGVSQKEAQALARPQQLTPIQQEVVGWHHRLYHLDFKHLFRLAKFGVLPKSLLQCEKAPPKCLECLFGNARRRPWRHKGKSCGSIKKKNEVLPGDGVSADQVVSAQPGLVPQMSGKLTSERIWGATTFVDHVSDYVYVHTMKSFTSEDTLVAKKAFEKIFTLAGRKVKSYRCDNGRFADKAWLDDCNLHQQAVSFCGVGHHSQNGKIEAKNKFLTLTARTLLLHGMRMWPEMISTYLWPFAMKAAADRHNTLHLDEDGLSPEAKLHGISMENVPVKTFHTLFCPVFVLDSRAHSAGGKVPKWEPRSRCGVYLGHSPIHAGSVALVFNPVTGLISPAFHVVFDDNFSTVPYMQNASVPPMWEQLVQTSSELATSEDFKLTDTWLKNSNEGNIEPLPMDGNRKRKATAITDPFAIVNDRHDSRNPATAAPITDPTATTSVAEGGRESGSLISAKEDDAAASHSTPQRSSNINATTTAVSEELSSTAETSAAQIPNELEMPKAINLAEAGLRRSERIKEQAERRATALSTIGNVTENFSRTRVGRCLYTALSTVSTEISMPNHNIYYHNEHSDGKSPTLTHRMMQKYHEANELYDGTFNATHLFSLVTQDLSSNETFHYGQAMQQADKDDFREAMIKEVRDHEQRGHWELVLRSDMPEGMKAIKSIWSFKRKRTPSGELLKHKARLCAHGGMQQWGENYWETYSPVVNMLTVRLLLLICKIHGLHSKSIDFVLAFPQADLEEDIWMELPIGFIYDDDDDDDDDTGRGRVHSNKSKYLLKLKKNLYGLKQASHNWYQHLKEGLMKRGLNPSEIDSCLYLKEGLAVLTYVDDCILVSTSQETLDNFVKSLIEGEEKFILTDEGDIDKFLGIEIKHYDDGSFELTQPHLIQRIVSELGLGDDNKWGQAAKSRATPSEKAILSKDSNGSPRKYEWKYRTAIGMLTYLQGNTRPDISVATHQCARFSMDPKRSHEVAVMRIGKYLRSSMDKGIIYKPDKKLGLECYVDADFAGGWQHADAESAESVMSRTGYILMYANCPIHWVSKLQTEIALSTAEAEYIALSQALREVIPLMEMMKELKAAFPMEITVPNFNCTVHEDNQSCISMATKQRFSPRTKHIALKYHHFRSFVNSKQIEIKYVNTHDQLADALTKPLDAETFLRLRKMLIGW